MAVVVIGVLAAFFLFGAAGRRLTKADLPKLRTLALRKAYIEREVNLCLSKQNHRDGLFTAGEVLGAVAGLGAGAVTGNFAAALKIAKGTASIAGNVLGTPDKCPGIEQRLAQQVKEHDQVSRELGLDPALSYAQVQQHIAQLGGLADVYAAQTAADWKRCVDFHGENYCKERFGK